MIEEIAASRLDGIQSLGHVAVSRGFSMSATLNKNTTGGTDHTPVKLTIKLTKNKRGIRSIGTGDSNDFPQSSGLKLRVVGTVGVTEFLNTDLVPGPFGIYYGIQDYIITPPPIVTSDYYDPAVQTWGTAAEKAANNAKPLSRSVDIKVTVLDSNGSNKYIRSSLNPPKELLETNATLDGGGSGHSVTETPQYYRYIRWFGQWLSELRVRGLLHPFESPYVYARYDTADGVPDGVAPLLQYWRRSGSGLSDAITGGNDLMLGLYERKQLLLPLPFYTSQVSPTSFGDSIGVPTPVNAYVEVVEESATSNSVYITDGHFSPAPHAGEGRTYRGIWPDSMTSADLKSNFSGPSGQTNVDTAELGAYLDSSTGKETIGGSPPGAQYGPPLHDGF